MSGVPAESDVKRRGRLPKRLPSIYIVACFDDNGQIENGPWASTSELSARATIDTVNDATWARYECVFVGRARILK